VVTVQGWVQQKEQPYTGRWKGRAATSRHTT
jgi:hypothetical protein